MSSAARGRAAHVVPFALAALLPLVLGRLPGPAWDPVLVLLGGALTASVVALMVYAPWRRLPSAAAFVPLALALLAVGVLREAGGGNSSGLGPLVILPALWCAIYGSRAHFVAALAGAGLLYWLPIALDGTETKYPASGWRVGTVAVVVAAVAGWMVQRLRATVAGQAEQLRALAHADPLTGLPNRRAWDERLEQAIARGRRRDASLCVALIDVDGFKRVNDEQGHEAGDRLLKALATAWDASLREGDLLARLGGDEFAVLLEDCEQDDAETTLERVRAAARGATCSIGVTRLDPDESAGAVVRRADAALYAAKQAGRDRVVAFVPAHDRG